MQIIDYLNLYDSRLNTLIEENPTNFTKETLREAVIDTVHQLTPLRLDEHQTNKRITSVLNKYRRAVRFHGEVDHYEDSVDSNLLSGLLLRYCKREKSFHHAYVRLQQEINGRITFAEDIIFLSEQEIEDAVLEDIRLASSSDKTKLEKQDTQFIDLLLSNHAQELLKVLHLLLDHTSNKKDFAIAIIALEQLGLLSKYGTKRNLYKTLQSEFTNIGTESNLNTYLNPTNRRMILDSEIESFIIPINKLLHKHS